MSIASLNVLVGPMMFAVLGVAAYVVTGWFIRSSDNAPS